MFRVFGDSYSEIFVTVLNKDGNEVPDQDILTALEKELERESKNTAKDNDHAERALALGIEAVKNADSLREARRAREARQAARNARK